MAPDPTDSPDDDADPSAAAPDDSGSDAAAQPTVLCTIMSNGDGSYTLTEGDEDDDGDSGDADVSDSDVSGDGADMAGGGDTGGDDAGAGEGAEGMPPAAGGVAAAPKGQTFDSPGPLLKAVLELLKADEEKSGGSADDNFNAGFSGASGATPKS